MVLIYVFNIFLVEIFRLKKITHIIDTLCLNILGN